MPPPRGVLCDLCGQKFFKHSLPIHRKKCAEMREKAFAECPKCLRRISNDEYSEHVSACTVVRKKLPPRTKAKPSKKERPVATKKQQVTENDDETSEEETSSDEEDARQECEFCRRKFNPDRIGKHEQICATNNSRKPRKKFMSAADARLAGTDFEKYRNKRIEIEKPSSRWRHEHLRLQNMVEQARLVKEFQDAGIPLSELPHQGSDLKQLVDGGKAGAKKQGPKNKETPPPGMERCPHCERTFNESVAGRHIPKCKNTKNKPKRLVRKSKVVLEKPKADFTSKIKEAIKKVLASKTKKSSYFETKEASQYRIGEIAILEDGREGEIKFIGRINYLFPGYWVGLEMAQVGDGLNDGSYEGHRMFVCSPGKGLFVRPSKLKKKLFELNPNNKVNDAVETEKEGEPIKTSQDDKTKLKMKKSIMENAQTSTSKETHAKQKPSDSHPETPSFSKKDKLETKARATQKRTESPTPENNKNDNLIRKKKNKNGSMVDRLRKEVRENSPRNQEDTQTQGGALKLKKGKELRKEKQLKKDVQLLEELYGKTPTSTSIPSKASLGENTGRKLGGGQTAPSSKGRNDAAARAAYFDKMFANKKNM